MQPNIADCSKPATAASRHRCPQKSRVPVMAISGDQRFQGNQSKDALVQKDRDLTSIEDLVFRFRSHQMIQTLDLSSNSITCIPECISSFRNLRQLDLSQNYIQSFGGYLSNLKTLTRLNLSKNKLRAISASDIGQLTSLKTLLVSNNCITEIDGGIGRLLNLRVLYIDGNLMAYLPTSLRCLSSLRELKLDWCCYVRPEKSATITCSSTADMLMAVDPKKQAKAEFLSLQQVFQYFTVVEGCSSEGKVGLNDFIEHFSTQPRASNFADFLEDSLKQSHEGIFLHYIRCLPADQLTESELNKLIIMASRYELPYCLEELLKARFPRQLKVNEIEETILHQAAAHLWLPILEVIRRQGIEKEPVDRLGNTPIHRLLQKKNFKSIYSGPGISDQSIEECRGANTSPAIHFSGPSEGRVASDLTNSSPAGSESEHYALEFGKTVIQALGVLLDLGIDINRYNMAGLCAWHIPVIKENYVLYKMLRNSKFPSSSAIDWSLGVYHGTWPMIHVTASCNDWRFFVEFLEGKSRVNSIEFDQRLTLPDAYLQGPGKLLCKKLFYKHLKFDYCNLIKSVPDLEGDSLLKLRKKACLLRKKINMDIGLTQKSGCMTKSPSIKRLNPLLQVNKDASRFMCQTSIGQSNDSQTSANYVYCMNPKPGFQKFSSPKVLMPKEHTQSIHSAYSESDSKTVAHDAVEVAFNLQAHRDHNPRLASSWFENVVVNMMATRKTSQPGFRSFSNQSQNLNSSNQHQIGVAIQANTGRSIDSRVSESNGDISRPINISVDDIAEKAVVNRSRSIEVTGVIKNLNNEQNLKKSMHLKGLKALPRLSKLIVKLLLKDLIAFRYNSKALLEIMDLENSLEISKLRKILLPLSIFLAKADCLISRIASCIDTELISPLRILLKSELMHGNSLGVLKSSLLKFKTIIEKEEFPRKLFNEAILIARTESIIQQMFGDQLEARGEEALPCFRPQPSVNFKQGLKVVPGKPQFVRSPMFMSPKSGSLRLSKPKTWSKAPRVALCQADESSESSDNSITLDEGKLMKKKITPKILMQVGNQLGINTMMMASRKNLLSDTQLPMKHFIQDHDTGLKSLESKISKYRTGEKNEMQESQNPEGFRTCFTTGSKKTLYIPTTFQSIASRKLKNKLI
jgi:hypothetical protein